MVGRNITISIVGIVLISFSLFVSSISKAEEDADDRTTREIREFKDKSVLEDQKSKKFKIFSSVELGYTHLDNVDLDPEFDDDFASLDVEVAVGVEFVPTPGFDAYLELELSREFVLEEEEDSDEDTELVIDEVYFNLNNFVDRFSFRFGRQNFSDDREWLYDEDLDAARLFYRHSEFVLELSVANDELFDGDLLNDVNTDDDTDNYILSGKYKTKANEYSGFWIVRKDQESDVREVFVGLQSRGNIARRLSYWADAAYVGGKDGSDRIHGYGLDVGATYSFDALWKPRITLGYAFGTGDSDLDDNDDKEFRQTGLQTNESSFGGLTDFRYYGELFAPELSNIEIFTVGVGINPSRETSIDLVYHHYRQDELSDIQFGTGLDIDPDGLDRKLGSEIDFVLGWEVKDKFFLDAFLGYFDPGRAFFSESEDAWSVNILATVIF